jgi:hypothetical protein
MLHCSMVIQVFEPKTRNLKSFFTQKHGKKKHHIGLEIQT